ncbi:MAG TPA: hypothetical protein VGB27_08115 [Candidatus Binatia bacterium]
MYLAETTASAPSNLAGHEPAPAVTDYARALRAIGQDLTDLFPKVLEIDTDGVNFEARGQSHANPFHRVRERRFNKIWNKLIRKDAQAESITPELTTETFTRAYSADDIERLDQHYSANRSGQQKKPDNYSLAERLRTMGGIVNSRQGRLKQLRKNADRLFADYWDQDGKIQTAKLTTVILYRNQQSHDSQSNAALPKELWEGYDF